MPRVQKNIIKQLKAERQKTRKRLPSLKRRKANNKNTFVPLYDCEEAAAPAVLPTTPERERSRDHVKKLFYDAFLWKLELQRLYSILQSQNSTKNGL